MAKEERVRRKRYKIKKATPIRDRLEVKKREQEGTYASARRAVPSALQGLTAVFGMGTGGAPALNPAAQNVNKSLPRSDS